MHIHVVVEMYRNKVVLIKAFKHEGDAAKFYAARCADFTYNEVSYHMVTLEVTP